MAGLVLGADDQTKTLNIGQRAPDFNLPGIDGRNHGLKDYASARILVIIFTANHCRTAQSYERRIIQLVDDYKEKSVAFVAIAANDPLAVSPSELVFSDLNDSFEEMKIRAAERGFNFPYLYDGATQQVALAFGPVATPHLFIFDSDRILRYVGRIDDSENPSAVKHHDARNALEAMLAGRPVLVEKTRTFGCSIKWSDKRASVQREVDKMDQEAVTLESADAETLRKLVGNETPKLRLISLWVPDNRSSVEMLPYLVELNRMYRNSNFEVVSIGVGSPGKKEEALATLKGKKVACINYYFNQDDPAPLRAVVDANWQGEFPYTILVEPGGKIIQRQIGKIDSMKLKKVIALHPARQ